jgi:hypothetical protein
MARRRWSSNCPAPDSMMSAGRSLASGLRSGTWLHLGEAFNDPFMTQRGCRNFAITKPVAISGP